jgi:hypothetical protein
MSVGRKTRVAGIDHFGVGCDRWEADADRVDDTVRDKDITYREVAYYRIDGTT